MHNMNMPCAPSGSVTLLALRAMPKIQIPLFCGTRLASKSSKMKASAFFLGQTFANLAQSIRNPQNYLCGVSTKHIANFPNVCGDVLVFVCFGVVLVRFLLDFNIETGASLTTFIIKNTLTKIPRLTWQRCNTQNTQPLAHLTIAFFRR